MANNTQQSLRNNIEYTILTWSSKVSGEQRTELSKEASELVDLFVDIIEAECTRREQAARIDELRLFMSRTASVQTGQSWDVWDKRVTDNINTRIAELKERKES